MNPTTLKMATALVSAVTLAIPATAGIAGAISNNTAPALSETDQQNTNEKVADLLVKAANVQGSFAFNQETLSSNEEISERFAKASAALCANLPAYLETIQEQPITVGGAVDNGFSATLSEIASEEGSESYELACSCASNTPGGGAIANAEVEGVSLSSIASLAQAQ